MDMFKLSDIKAGYLLRFRDEKEQRDFNMTVVPARKFVPDMILVLFGDYKPQAAGDLACCGDEHFWPFNTVKENLVCGDRFKVIEVYGYTAPKFLLANSTEHRELLWKREEAEQPVDEPTEEPFKMTRQEVTEKLRKQGLHIEIVD